MRKIQEEYGTPDSWPESVLEDLGEFIDDMDMSQIAMLDEDNVCKPFFKKYISSSSKLLSNNSLFGGQL